MPDVPIQPEPEQDPMVAKLEALRDRADAAARVALTGSTTGRVRRPTLFVVAMLFTIFGLGLDGLLGLILGGVALIAMLLLAMTDQVVEL